MNHLLPETMLGMLTTGDEKRDMALISIHQRRQTGKAGMARACKVWFQIILAGKGSLS